MEVTRKQESHLQSLNEYNIINNWQLRSTEYDSLSTTVSLIKIHSKAFEPSTLQLFARVQQNIAIFMLWIFKVHPLWRLLPKEIVYFILGMALEERWECKIVLEELEGSNLEFFSSKEISIPLHLLIELCILKKNLWLYPLTQSVRRTPFLELEDSYSELWIKLENKILDSLQISSIKW